jgi:dTDP-glucose 4,6-dehydratase
MFGKAFSNNDIKIILDLQDVMLENCQNELLQVSINILNNSKERLDSKDAALGRYNIVGVKEASNLEVVEIISNIMNKKADYELIDFHSSRPGHDLRYALNGDKLSKLGWTPPINLEESIKKTVNWTLKNTQWL